MLCVCFRSCLIIENKRIAAYKLMSLASCYSGLANANIASGFTEMVSSSIYQLGWKLNFIVMLFRNYICSP